MDNAGQRLHLRVERQTLLRLPKSNAVLFTIRTYMNPLSTFEGRPDRVRSTMIFSSHDAILPHMTSSICYAQITMHARPVRRNAVLLCGCLSILAQDTAG